MDTEKKTDQPKQDLGEIVSDSVVSGATRLAHSAAETVVKRVKKAAAKLAPIEAVKKVQKKRRSRRWHQGCEGQESKESFQEIRPEEERR